MTTSIKLTTNFFDGVTIATSPKKHAQTILPGLLIGLRLKDIAQELNATAGSTKVFSHQIRKSLGIKTNSPYALVEECFKRGIDVTLTQQEIERFTKLKKEHRTILESIASDSLRSCRITQDEPHSTQIGLRREAYLAMTGAHPRHMKRKKNLLPATLFRAAQIYEARATNDLSFYPKTNVSLDENHPVDP